MVILTLGSLSAEGQESVAEEVVRVDASSATMLQWFGRIEKETGVVLSYNPSLLDMKRRCRFQRAGEIRIDRLLAVLLEGYDYQLVPLPDRKLLIRVDRVLYHDLSGTVREAGSNERLFGATVTVTDGKGNKSYDVTDNNGVFNIKVSDGDCRVEVSYVGYTAYDEHLRVAGDDRFVLVDLKPIPFRLKAVNVKRRKSVEEFDEVSPSNMTSFSSTDLFAQLRILPGVSSSQANLDFNVYGGSTDENLFLLDGFPIHNPGHINSMLTAFNGDALKSVSFYNGFIPTRFEGRLSSVTDARVRDGNKRRFVNTLSLDMPAASAVLEGPIVKNKLSYIISGRRSWLDFFDGMLAEKDRTNHTFYDFNVKLSCDLDSATSMSVSAYNSSDDQHYREEGEKPHSLLHWHNQLYAFHFNTSLSSQVTNSTSIAYSSHTNSANGEDFDNDSTGIVSTHIQSYYAITEFTYNPGSVYTVRWGLKGMYERYGLVTHGKELKNSWEPTRKFSMFYDSRIRITPRLYTQVGLNFVMYIPRNYRRYYSVQPRFSLKYSIGDEDLLYAGLSNMEQYYHHVRMSEVPTPFDFIMPTIGNLKPSAATHIETGWKHFLPNGIMEFSLYYKHRKHILGLFPTIGSGGEDWVNNILDGNGDSYGASLYVNNSWKRLNWQFSYTLSSSREWFDRLNGQEKMPSLYDVPHILNAAVAYDIGKHSTVALGANMHSGRVLLNVEYKENGKPEYSRSERDPMRYRVDASYTFRRDFKKSRLLLRFGLYNVLGNPSEAEMLYFFSIKFNNHCMPFGTVSFRF